MKAKTKNHTKCFDCLQFKESVQAEILEQTKDMSRASLTKYFEKRVQSGCFADLWKQISTRTQGSR